ncbi:hypothetical protein BHM03_00062509 [Ensete ventricosum]|nr:hypothetical protein BHM03_00062509 [Ensete ventricosum]
MTTEQQEVKAMEVDKAVEAENDEAGARRRRKEDDLQEEEEEERELVVVASIEREFDEKQVPTWRKQLTAWAFAMSLVLVVVFNVIMMKFMLTTGIVPSLNVSVSPFVQTWTTVLGRVGLLRSPFTRQENTVIQTCVIAASGIAYNDNDHRLQADLSEWHCDDEPNQLLPHPSGSQPSEVTPNNHERLPFFSPATESVRDLANVSCRKQVRTLGKLSVCSYLWGFFQWFYTGGKDRGFINFPSLGLKAYDNIYASQNLQILYDIYLIRKGLQVLGFLRWGRDDLPIHREHICALGRHPLMGNHVASDRRQERRLVFIAIALILGDGLYNFVTVMGKEHSRLRVTVQEQKIRKNAHLRYRHIGLLGKE